MKGEKNKKGIKLGQVAWLAVVGAGALMIFVSIVSSLVGVGAPHPTDPAQKYNCGSVLSPVYSLSDSEYSTNIVCRDVMAARRGSVFWLEVFGWILMVGGVVMLVRGVVRKPKAKNAENE